MNHLKSIYKKTTQDYLDIINSKYNLKVLTNEINNSLKRYDIDYINCNLKILYGLNVYADTTTFKNNIVLWTRYDSICVYFDTLTGQQIKQDGNYLIRDVEGNFVYDYIGLNNRLKSEANECKLEISLIYTKESDDLILESLYFLFRKYGFEMVKPNKLVFNSYEESQRFKIITLVKNII